jgi:hypothetical protein
MKLVEYLEEKTKDNKKQKTPNKINPTLLEQDIVSAFNGENKFTSEKNKALALSIVKFLKEKKVSGKAEWSGRGNGTLNKNWTGKDTTPKADFKIGKYNISLKYGPSQVMSGGSEETISTFNAAIKKTSKKVSTDVKKIVEDISENFTKGISKTNISNELKKKKDKNILNADAFHKEIKKKIETYFETNEVFKVAFFKEALTGESKFSDTNSIATHVLSISKSGGINFSEINDEYAKKIADHTKISVRFKSTSKKVGGEKTGEYSYWSVMGLVTADPKNIYKESDDDSFRYDEGIFDSFKEKIKNAFTRIKTYISKGFDYILKFFGFVPEVSIENNIIEFP